ncbi:MAG: T9SS type A sorting domain-containing protein, partial [Bacteroidales bacterium]|nr:T9SS type A sorting domain-containing protein [Bacteroidales bacterium]
ETLVLDANSTSCSADYDNYSYLWSTDETTETITVSATTLGVGSYTYSVSVTNNSTTSNCITSDMINVNVSSANAIETLVMDDISIYPNPTDGILKLEFSNTIENTWIRIINVTGQVVYSEYLENLTGIKTLDLSGLDKGVYILSIQNKNTILTNKITLY